MCPGIGLRAAGEWGVGPCTNDQTLLPLSAKSHRRRLLWGEGTWHKLGLPSGLKRTEHMQTCRDLIGDTHMDLLGLAVGCGDKPSTQHCPNRKCFSCKQKTWAMASFPWELHLDFSLGLPLTPLCPVRHSPSPGCTEVLSRAAGKDVTLASLIRIHSPKSSGSRDLPSKSTQITGKGF